MVQFEEKVGFGDVEGHYDSDVQKSELGNRAGTLMYIRRKGWILVYTPLYECDTKA